MRHRLALIAVALVLLPSIAVAQRRGRSRSRDANSDPFAQMGSTPTLKARDLENLDPLKVIIDKKKDLKLTDEQVAAFKQADEQLKETQAPFFSVVDSLSRALRPGSGQPSEADRIRLQLGHRLLRETVDSVRIHYRAAGKDAVATLDADAQTKANELIAKKVEDAEKRIREHGGGGGRRRGGSPPG